MPELAPTCAKDLAEALHHAAQAGQAIALGGAWSKNRMAGPLAEAPVTLSTRALNRVLLYEPKDLTISVEAGLPYAELTALLAANRQMLPLDPPCSAQATIGGVVASNSAGPRRRLYGAARDMVIGMTYATLDGELAQSGAMVVKNVAGLDVQKTLIGSFGTLAAITSINFKLAPLPEATRTFVLSFPSPAEAAAARDSILQGVLQPAALDLLNAPAAAEAGLIGNCLILRAGGSSALLNRYSKELPQATVLSANAEAALWSKIEDFCPSHACVIRVGHALSELAAVLATAPGPALSRAGNGVTYLAFDSPSAIADWLESTQSRNWARVVEWAPEPAKSGLDLWPSPDGSLSLMQMMKSLFDPNQLLNRGRLYGRL
jgi:glycolate oxidase FAD binding subunit